MLICIEIFEKKLSISTKNKDTIDPLLEGSLGYIAITLRKMSNHNNNNNINAIRKIWPIKDRKFNSGNILTFREKDRLADAITEDTVKILKIENTKLWCLCLLITFI
jgi:hypothetical protein